jgi:uncharacterized protein YndB with AHSA1/START domain
MSTVSRRINATADRVWEVLSDGWLYSGWVVGASHIRRVDDEWPNADARLHHSVGSWPFMVSDSTQVLESQPARLLVLQARAWPFGEARVRVEITPDGAACDVTMSETPTDGPGRWLHNPLLYRALDARNRESLARLADMAEGGAAT